MIRSMRPFWQGRELGRRIIHLRHDAKLGDPLWAKGIRAPKIQQRRTRAQFFHRSTMSTNFLSRASPREMASSGDSLSSVASHRADGEKLGPRGSRNKKRWWPHFAKSSHQDDLGKYGNRKSLNATWLAEPFHSIFASLSFSHDT